MEITKPFTKQKKIVLNRPRHAISIGSPLFIVGGNLQIRKGFARREIVESSFLGYFTRQFPYLKSRRAEEPRPRGNWVYDRNTLASALAIEAKKIHHFAITMGRNKKEVRYYVAQFSFVKIPTSFSWVSTTHRFAVKESDSENLERSFSRGCVLVS